MPTAQRLLAVAEALRDGTSARRRGRANAFRPWFVQQMAEMLEAEAALATVRPGRMLPREACWRTPSGWAFRTCRSATGTACQDGAGRSQRRWQAVRARRLALGIRPGYYRVDTCAAEFEAFTPYLYSTYESGDETDADRPAQGDDHGRRTQPHRAGHRV